MLTANTRGARNVPDILRNVPQTRCKQPNLEQVSSLFPHQPFPPPDQVENCVPLFLWHHSILSTLPCRPSPSAAMTSSVKDTSNVSAACATNVIPPSPGNLASAPSAIMPAVLSVLATRKPSTHPPFHSSLPSTSPTLLYSPLSTTNMANINPLSLVLNSKSTLVVILGISPPPKYPPHPPLPWSDLPRVSTGSATIAPSRAETTKRSVIAVDIIVASSVRATCLGRYGLTWY